MLTDVVFSIVVLVGIVLGVLFCWRKSTKKAEDSKKEDGSS